MSTPGWYNDESDPALARWHDGVAWTDHVVDKADWESVGHEPPPPAELWADDGPSRANRVRLAVGSAAAVAVLLIAGVALAQSGRDGGGDDTTPSTVRRSDLADDAAGGLEVSTSITAGEPIDPATGLPLYGAGSAGGGSAGTTGATTGTKASSSTKTANGVTRTERRSESHTSPSVQSTVVGGDKSSVGNTTNTSIKQTPPPTAAPTQAPPPTDSTVPAETTTTG